MNAPDTSSTLDPAALLSLPAEPGLVGLAAGAIALLMAHAAVTKLLDRPLFAAQLAAYRVPAVLVPLLAWLLPLAEGLAAALLAGAGRPAGAWLAAGLLLLYAAAMAVQLLQGRRPDCGCGGDALPVSWLLVARNLGLAALALAGGLPLSRPPGWGDAAVALAGIVLATALHAAAHQLLRHPSAVRRAVAPTRWRT